MGRKRSSCVPQPSASLTLKNVSALANVPRQSGATAKFRRKSHFDFSRVNKSAAAMMSVAATNNDSDEVG